MKEIRAKVVEAMAQAYWEKYYLEPPWAEISGPQRQVILDAIEAALDAALDVLGDEIHEWIEAEAQLFQSLPRPRLTGWTRTNSSNVERLLAVLRAGKGSE